MEVGGLTNGGLNCCRKAALLRLAISFGGGLTGTLGSGLNAGSAAVRPSASGIGWDSSVTETFFFFRRWVVVWALMMDLAP